MVTTVMIIMKGGGSLFMFIVSDQPSLQSYLVLSNWIGPSYSDEKSLHVEIFLKLNLTEEDTIIVFLF